MKLGLSIAVAAMLGIALLIGLLLRPASAPSAGAPPSLASPTLEIATAPEPASRAPIEGVVRAAVDLSASTAETVSGEIVAVRGLCLAAEDRRPLASCVVGAGSPFLHVRTAHELDGASSLSDERGTFRLEVAASFQPRELWIEGEGRCRRRIELRALDGWARAVDSDPAREIDLGEILLDRGREVRGVVREPDGKPIARAELFAHVPVREDLEFAVVTAAPEVTLFARSDVQGRFAFVPHAPAGRYEFELVQPKSHELLSPQGFALEGEGHEALELVVTAVPLPRITGRLRIAGLAELHPGWSEGLVIVGTDRSRVPFAPTLDVTGSFVFEARRGEREPLQIEITGGDFAPLRLPQAIPWGTSDLEIELVTAGSLHLTVVDAQSGAPIERFAAFCASRDPQAPKPALEWPEPARHEGGTLRLGGVPAGAWVLHVWTDQAGYFGTREIHFEKQHEETPRFRVEFERRAARHVVVRNAHAELVAGAELALFDAATFGEGVLPIASARTDADGAARIEAVGIKGPFLLRIREPLRGLVVLEEVQLGSDLPALEIALPMAGTVQGRVEPREIASRAPFYVELRGVDPRATKHLVLPQDLGSDGSFRWEGVPPGAWEVHVLLPRLATSLAVEPILVAPGDGVNVGTLAPNAARCAALTLSVTWSEGSLEGSRLELRRRSRSSERHPQLPVAIEHMLSSEQRATFDFLAEGEYSLRLVHAASHDRVEMLYPHPIVLELGAQKELHWQVEARRLRFRALGPDGAALANEDLITTPGRSLRCRTDEQGYVELRLAPFTAISLQRLRHAGASAILAEGRSGDLGDVVFQAQD
ncbi:MAG: hypothetical protein JNM84_13425 [Planctomycetes bacterium]|nr:hypothetical protein [Planctomycetota bacterium]